MGLPAQNVLDGVLNSRSKPNTLLEWVEIGSIATAVFAKELFSLAQLVAAGKFNVTPLQYQLEEFSQENW